MGIQVQELTQDKQPWDKEFIDFSFAGKHISEFGMVAVSDGDRYSRSFSPSFNDETSTVNGLSGQYYWGTTLQAGTITFSLATDGVTEKQIAALKSHFAPGKYGKLFTDELIGRYCWARVSSPITLSFVPFQEDITIQGITFTTNIYKGNASITFTMDYPYWIASYNYIDSASSLTQETIREAFANNIPVSGSFYTDLTVNSKLIVGQADTVDSSILLDNRAYSDILAALDNKQMSSFVTSGENIIVGDSTYMLAKDGIAALTSYDASTDTDKTKLILYNPSETPSPVRLTLKNQPITVSSSAPYYITYARDSINTNAAKRQYDMYFIRNYNEQITNVLKYTNPGVFYYINKTIQLAYENSTMSLIDFQDKLHEEIHHNKVLTWAARGLRFITNHSELYDSETGKLLTGSITIYDCNGTAQSVKWYEYLNYWMLFMCAPATENTDGKIDIAEKEGTVWDRDGTYGTFDLIIDGQSTTASITYNYHTIGTVLTNLINSGENCSELVLSGYLKVDGGSFLDEELKIEPTSCFLLYNLKDASITNLDKANMIVEYRYLYL